MFSLELLVWYLEQRESELHSQEDLEQASSLARKVLKRMVNVSITHLVFSLDMLTSQRIMC